jgi:NADPH:quinone reductase-like Zn-dependent oxidoreductase
LITTDIPNIPAGKVLIKIAYASLHIFDQLLYNIIGKTDGFVLGCEGSGTVVEVGEGVDPSLKGKKVGFRMRSWATHTIAEPQELIVFNDHVALDKASAAYVNPTTAIAQLVIT